jgi:hypothetical protein
VDDVSDAAHRVLEHLIRVDEGLVLRDVVAHPLEQLFALHDASKRREKLNDGLRPSVRAV